ncbi:MAG TPA: S53 family peptidase [Gaiellaceae bacterium]|nr:S53 family peptidase [Gaiellaceae bacterium]
MKKGLIAAAAVVALLIAAAGGAVNAKSASAKVPVPQGISALLLTNTAKHGGSSPPVFPIDNQTPANTPEDVTFVLDIQNRHQLESLVSNNMNGRFLSVDQFARSFGQSRQNIDALQSYLKHYGITTNVMADGLDVQANGTAQQFDNALGTHQRDYRTQAVPAHDGHPAVPARNFHGSSSNPLLPRQLASFVDVILGLTNYPTFSSNAIRVPQSTSAGKNTLQLGDRTPEDFAKDYNLPNGSGRGSTIGIVTLAGTDTQSAYDFWTELGLNTKPNRITVDNIDGGPGDLSTAGGSSESTLDVEQSGALAPQANVIVYQSPNTDPGFVDDFFQAASDNKADGVSASWGEGETLVSFFQKNGLEDPNYQDAFDEAFLEMAAQGQSSFVSSGDSGAYDSYLPGAGFPFTNLDVDTPGISPWVTSSGGTTEAGIIPLAADSSGNITDSEQIKHERAWSWTWLWPHYADFCDTTDPNCTEENFAFAEPAGDGGGYASSESMPSWQRQVGAQHFNATEFLTPTDFDSTDFAPLNVPTAWNFNPSPSVTSGNGNGRGEPDVSADADPFTGYQELYEWGAEPGSPAPETTEDGWGGTSFVDPQLNGSNAVMVANLGHRIGFWNPQIYSFAQSHNSPFHTLDSASTDNNNLYYTGTPGQVWNPASGLGTPDLSALQSDFAHSGH